MVKIITFLNYEKGFLGALLNISCSSSQLSCWGHKRDTLLFQMSVGILAGGSEGRPPSSCPHISDFGCNALCVFTLLGCFFSFSISHLEFAAASPSSHCSQERSHRATGAEEGAPWHPFSFSLKNLGLFWNNQCDSTLLRHSG